MQYSSNKKKINLFLALGLSIFLTSCTSVVSSSSVAKNVDISWRKFYDENNKKFKEIAFLETVHLPEHNVKIHDSVGSARIKGGQRFDIFRIDNQKQFSLINMDNQLSLLKVSPENFKDFSNAKYLKFFEFGSGLLEVVNFNSQNGVCRDYKSNKGVNFNFSTNYYKNYDVFTTLFGSSRLSQKKGTTTTLETSIYSYPKTEETKTFENQIKNQLKRLIEADVGKISSFLNFLCRKNNH